LISGNDIHQLATQMGTNVKMLDTFYSKVAPQMNAAMHSDRLENMWREEQED
jgi:predicted GNAT superfamily acetyltransferase